jgi:hypothetical protein
MQIDFNTNLNLIIIKKLVRTLGVKPYILFSLFYLVRVFFSEVVQYLSLINFAVLQTDGEHEEHRHRSWPTGAEQPEYRPAAADASTSDFGAVLPAPDADDGHSEQHCSGSAADPRSATTSYTAAAPQQARGLSEGSPADVLPCG